MRRSAPRAPASARDTGRTTRPRSRRRRAARASARRRRLSNVASVTSTALDCSYRDDDIGPAAGDERGANVLRPRRPGASGGRGRPRSPARRRAPASAPRPRSRTRAAPRSRRRRGGRSAGVRCPRARGAPRTGRSDVRVRADADRDAARADALGREEAVAEVRLRRRAGADRRAVRGEEVELSPVGVGRVHDRRPLGQAAGPREQLDRPAPVLGEALLDLFRLLVGVDVQREAVLGSVAADLLEPVGRARAYGVGCEPDCDPVAAQLLDLARGIPQRTPVGSEGDLRARTRRGGGRTRRRPRSRLRQRRAPRPRPGSGTRRRPCSRPRSISR